MRLFVALEVPGRVRTPLDAAVAPLRPRHEELRWTPAEQWHITLAFLGSVQAPVEAVEAALEPAAAAAPARVDLRLGDAGRFSSRVLWVGVVDDPAGAVRQLGRAVQSALAAAGLRVDEKPVRPHLTLARTRERRGREVTREVVEEVPPVEAAWTVRELVLFDSVRGGHRQPNRYVPLARVPLGGA